VRVVTFRGHEDLGFEILEGSDRSGEEAESFARELYDKIGSNDCSDAIVDRIDGLVLIFRLPGGGVSTHHFRSATAGFLGGGSITAARILELFGFGAKADLLDQVATGGETAQFVFKK